MDISQDDRQLNSLNMQRAKEEYMTNGASSLMSLGKLAMSRIQHGEARLSAKILGAQVLFDETEDAQNANFDAGKAYMNSIGGGTDQIQRNIIAEWVLECQNRMIWIKKFPSRTEKQARKVKAALNHYIIKEIKMRKLGLSLLLSTAAILSACGEKSTVVEAIEKPKNAQENNAKSTSIDDLRSEINATVDHAASAVNTGPLTRTIRGDQPISEFYMYTDQLPNETGVLLRQENLEPHQTVKSAHQSLRLLYTSTDGIDGVTRIPVSGSLLFPAGDAPEGGWPLVLWSHGTVGVADNCAPTWTGYRQFHQDHLNHWLDQGYAVVTSDYQGLGTKGTHPYLATQTSSYSNLDVIRAVQNADFPVSDSVVLIGQSQGAAAAFATAGYAENYAPELDIRGVVATGIPYFTPKTIEILSKHRPRDVVDPMLGYNFLALTLIEQLEADFDASVFISDAAMPVFNKVEDTCYQQMQGLVKEAKLTYNTSFKSEPTEKLNIAFAKMGYPTMELSVPAFIGTGAQDRDTPMRMQAGLVKTACAAGSKIQSHLYEGHDHLTVLNHSTMDSTGFVKAAFAGDTLNGNCDSLPF